MTNITLEKMVEILNMKGEKIWSLKKFEGFNLLTTCQNVCGKGNIVVDKNNIVSRITFEIGILDMSDNRYSGNRNTVSVNITDKEQGLGANNNSIASRFDVLSYDDILYLSSLINIDEVVSYMDMHEIVAV